MSVSASPMPTPAAAAPRRVLIAGASGLVGQELLRRLLADPGCAVVHSVGRRTLPLTDARLRQVSADFSALPPLPAATEAYIALGTTLAVAGSQAAFRAVDFDAVLAFARAAQAAGVARLGVVSAMGADAGSRLFYNRVKGEMEQALRALGFEVLVIARPALISGDRAALGQPGRQAEGLGLVLMRALAPLTPRTLRPIAAARVAVALLEAVAHGPAGTRVLTSGEMNRP